MLGDHVFDGGDVAHGDVGVVAFEVEEGDEFVGGVGVSRGGYLPDVFEEEAIDAGVSVGWYCELSEYGFGLAYVFVFVEQWGGSRMHKAINKWYDSWLLLSKFEGIAFFQSIIKTKL